MERYIHPDYFIDDGRPSIKFQMPEEADQENQETTSPSFSLSELHMRLYWDTFHNVINLVDFNPSIHITRRVETRVQYRVYLRNEALVRDLRTVLHNWNVPETHHLDILTSIVEQVSEVLPDCAASLALVTPCLLLVHLTCHKIYSPDADIVPLITALLENNLQEENDENDSDGMLPASESAIKSLVSRKRKRDKTDEEEEGSCPICLDDFTAGSEIGSLPCSHIFHQDCITIWLRKSHYCPLCRFEMPTAKSDDD